MHATEDALHAGSCWSRRGDAQEKALLQEAWQWRELLQRGIDGCDSTADMSAPCLANYAELPGPNTPLPCGYSVINPCSVQPWPTIVPIFCGRTHAEVGDRAIDHQFASWAECGSTAILCGTEEICHRKLCEGCTSSLTSKILTCALLCFAAGWLLYD